MDNQSDGTVLLTSKENPIYFCPSPVQEDEARLQQKYKGRCLFEIYETDEVEGETPDTKVKELARYIVVWDDEQGFPLTIVDGLWVEGKGCVSNAVVATGTSDEVRQKYANWFQTQTDKEVAPVGFGYDKCAVGVIPPSEMVVERAVGSSLDEAKEAVQSIFDAYFAEEPSKGSV